MQKDQKLDIKVNKFTDKETGEAILNIAFESDYMAELMPKIENTDGWNHITFFPVKNKDNGEVYYLARLNTYIPKHKRGYETKKK